MKKILVILVGFAFIATLGISASAEESGSVTDPTGDVMHWRHTGTTWGWETNVVDKPDIDITDISYEVNGDQVTLTLKVEGTIVSSDLVSYWAYLNSSDSNYFFHWLNGEGSGWAVNTEEGSFQMDYEPDMVASGNTISATFDLVGTFTSGVDLWGWAVEYITYGDTMDEWWADWAPNEESPYYNQYEGDGDLINDSGDNGDDNDDGDNDDNGDDTGSDDAASGIIEDPANDVYIPGGQTGISNQQHLDIREISYSFDDSGLTLTMELQGTVSDDATYTVTLETEDASYGIIYDYGEWSNVAASEAGEFLPYLPGDEAASVSGNTITVLFDRVGSSTNVVDFWGQALELGGARDDVPNEKGETTDAGTDDNGDGSGVPGFEIMFLIIALAVAMIVFKRKKI